VGFVYAPYLKSGKHQPTYRNIKIVGYVWVLNDINTYIYIYIPSAFGKLETKVI
jgi:hypothetical protein